MTSGKIPKFSLFLVLTIAFFMVQFVHNRNTADLLAVVLTIHSLTLGNRQTILGGPGSIPGKP
jgi:hypothetical protein